MNHTDSRSDEEDVVLFVEQKFCSACHLEMPIRCKHCKDCDHCVATHDHHCPWVNNCIGELNSRQFYIYLHCQTAQLIAGLIIAAKIGLAPKELEIQPTPASLALLFTVVLLMSGWFLFLCSLLALHTYLIAKGLTSWEYLSWMNITYLKIWPRKYGSPFSAGSTIDNFKLFFRTRPGPC